MNLLARASLSALAKSIYYRETEATRLASGENRWLQFPNKRGRGRSRDQMTWISFLEFIIYNSSWMSLTIAFGKCT